MSHLGRPDGKVNPEYSLKPVVPELEKLLGTKVIFTNDCVGKEVEETVNGVSHGGIVLLENLRFHAEEEGSSKDESGKKVKADKDAVAKFREGLTALGDVYISEFRFCLTVMKANFENVASADPYTIRRRRLWHRSPRPLIHGWCGPSPACRRLPHEEGT